MKVVVLLLVLVVVFVWVGGGQFFDDFLQKDLVVLCVGGWVLCEGMGYFGLLGLYFLFEQLLLEGGLFKLKFFIDGKVEYMMFVQLCGLCKFFVGMMMVCVCFCDMVGLCDFIIQSFFFVGLLKYDYDFDFSEVDFEYLLYGGWGELQMWFYGVSWYIVCIDFWEFFNQVFILLGFFDGWQLLIVQVEVMCMCYYVNGWLIGEYSGCNVLSQLMVISFNYWILVGVVEGVLCDYEFEVDWVLYEVGCMFMFVVMQVCVV